MTVEDCIHYLNERGAGHKRSAELCRSLNGSESMAKWLDTRAQECISAAESIAVRHRFHETVAVLENN